MNYPHFIWKIESKKPITGEMKTEIADKMAKIATFVSNDAIGTAKSEIFYAANLVGLKITVSPTTEMRKKAQTEAYKIANKGFMGFFAKFFLFLKGIDFSAIERVENGIAERILFDKCQASLNSLRIKLLLAVELSSAANKETLINSIVDNK